MIKLSRKVLCLDWDTHAVRFVVARIGAGQMKLEDAHSHLLPDTLEPDNPQALGEFIQQMMRKHHWHYKRVVVDIPREKAVINRLELPPTPPDELAAAVRFQAIKELPFSLEEAVVDFSVMRQNENGLATEALLAAVPLDALDVVRRTCEAAGLTPARIGLRPYANLVSTRQVFGSADERVLFVDVGAAMTEIDVFAAGRLAFTRSANVTVPLTHAVPSDDSRVTTLAEATDPAVADEALTVAVSELAVEVTRTLQAFRASDAGVVIDRLVIAGGTGIEPRLLETVKRRLGLSGELFDPTGTLEVSADEATKLRAFSAALGLAWGLGREGSLGIDFLNPKKPILPGATLKRRLRIGAAVAGVILAAAIATDITLYLGCSGELAEQRTVINGLKSKLNRALKIENLVEEVRDWQHEAIWPEHLLQVTEATVDPGKSMLVQQITMTAREASINLKKVLASHWDVPTEFVSRLNEFQVDGKPVYRATQGGWRTLSTSDARFKGAVDVQVNLLDLQKHLNGREERVKERKRKLKGL
ncbi:MAG: pilus assembly protein PilM [Planctomycetota bacterium]